jgi:hypothetical protein
LVVIPVSPWYQSNLTEKESGSYNPVNHLRDFLRNL